MTGAAGKSLSLTRAVPEPRPVVRETGRVCSKGTLCTATGGGGCSGRRASSHVATHHGRLPAAGSEGLWGSCQGPGEAGPGLAGTMALRWGFHAPLAVPAVPVWWRHEARNGCAEGELWADGETTRAHADSGGRGRVATGTGVLPSHRSQDMRPPAALGGLMDIRHKGTKNRLSSG